MDKSEARFGRSFALALLAGAYIAIGALFAVKVAGNMPEAYWGTAARLVFGAVFPLGILLVLITGANLFTGNCMYMPVALLHRKISRAGLIKSWGISYGGNLLGALFVVYFLAHVGRLFVDPGPDGSLPLAAFVVDLANYKCDLPFAVAFIRGLGCNWLVCLAIYFSLAADDGISKAVLIWPPITAFVAIGFEHCVANMAFIPLGILLGSSDIYLNTAAPSMPFLSASWQSFFTNNLLPVTLGNIAGAGVFVIGLYFKANGLNDAVVREQAPRHLRERAPLTGYCRES